MVHPQLSHKKLPMDGGLVGVGSHHPLTHPMQTLISKQNTFFTQKQGFDMLSQGFNLQMNNQPSFLFEFVGTL